METTQDQLQLSCMFCLDASFGSGQEKSLQTLVRKILDHNKKCNLCRYKRETTMKPGCERQGVRFSRCCVQAIPYLEIEPVQRRPGRQDRCERRRAVAARFCAGLVDER